MAMDGAVVWIGELPRGKRHGRPFQGDFCLELVEVVLLL
jgi:hypothetical protein